MRKTMIRIILLLAVVAPIINSCSPAKVVTEIPVETITTVRTRLVPVYLKPDSSYLQMLFECDSLNKVFLREMSEQKTENVQTEFSLTNNRLTYKTKFIHDTIFITVVDTIIVKDKPLTIPVMVKVNEIEAWQRFLMWAGAIGLALLLLIILSKFF